MFHILASTPSIALIMNIFIATISLGLLSCSTLYAEPRQPLAPGYSPLTFDIPQVGSYELPIISSAADGEVLSTVGQSHHLYDFMGDKITLLSFIYSTCSDVNGCPLATQVFHKINRRLQQEPEIAEKLRLLTLSFNPEHDTPVAMARYASSFSNAKVDWQFLTTQSEQQLQPILNHYQQAVQKIYDQEGLFTGTFSHILRVYLIDKDKQIRNIYSVSFLHADTLINDVKTLLKTEYIFADSSIELRKQGVGDHQAAYAQKNSKNFSLSLSQRQGERADLLANIKHPPLGLPPVLIPDSRIVDSAKIALGRKLFFDRRMSLNNTISCAMCHIPEQGFSSNEMATAVGIEGRSVRRNSPTIYNVAYATSLFHDARESTLEQQVWGPLLAHNEMGNPSIGYVIDKIISLAEYPGLFQESFNAAPNMVTIGQALASYQRSLVSADSHFDRWYFGQQTDAVTPSVKRGFALFKGKGGCSQCHTIEKNFALFTDNQLHNTGIGYRESMYKMPTQQKIQIAPGVFVEVDPKLVATVAEVKPNDLGRYEITQDPKDRWKYKTPSLRNIALTAPYMHNGSLATLAEVIQFYNQGGVSNEVLDPVIKPLNLNASEKSDLLAFLHALTGSNVQKLVADAYAAPVGN